MQKRVVIVIGALFVMLLLEVGVQAKTAATWSEWVKDKQEMKDKKEKAAATFNNYRVQACRGQLDEAKKLDCVSMYDALVGEMEAQKQLLQAAIDAVDLPTDQRDHMVGSLMSAFGAADKATGVVTRHVLAIYPPPRATGSNEPY